MQRGTGSLLLLLILSAFVSADVYSFQGKVTDEAGNPIGNALVGITGSELFTSSDDGGNYILEGEIAAAVVPYIQPAVAEGFIDRGILHMILSSESMIGVEIFRLNGTLVNRSAPCRYPAGMHVLPLFSSGYHLSNALHIVRLAVNGRVRNAAYVPSSRVSLQGVFGTHGTYTRSASITASGTPLIRASAVGYTSADTLATSNSGTIDFTLDALERQETGTSGLEDGSTDRLAFLGNEQYFWGDPGTGEEIPMVKIVTAVSEVAVDIALIFNPGFVDNTYGTGVVGWNKHTFESLVKSDHVELTVRNGDGETVFAGKIDMITASPDASSGYATLGPYGGDGTISEGTNEHILSFGTSMDDNLNYYGYELFENSPETDSLYTPNAEYPHWEYYAIYRISFDPALFGESGYGDVQMTSVHASPAKTPQETVIVTEGDPPTDTDDPFTKTPFDNPPTDPPDDGENPPTDPPDDGENPPTDPIDGGELPPTDPIDNPVDDS